MPNIPIILMTDTEKRTVADRGLQGGTFDFVQKPIEREAFIALSAARCKLVISVGMSGSPARHLPAGVGL